MIVWRTLLTVIKFDILCNMKKVVIASLNPVKIAVAKRAFALVYPNQPVEFIAVESDSGVPNQPMGDETEQGAMNRLSFVQAIHTDADFWISQEGGLYKEGTQYYNRAWIAVTDSYGYVAKSSTALFYLPPKIAKYIDDGMELGHASDKFFGSVDSKRSVGTIGYLTDGIINREDCYLQAAIITLSEIKNKHWYQ